MAKQKKRGRPSENAAIEPEESENEVKNDEVSGYELSRDQRIKENLQRMQKLGILDLSRQLKSTRKRLKRNPSQKKPSLPPDPPRRSSRLMTVTRVTYKELRLPKEKEKLDSDEIEIYIKEGSKPEIYTEEDEKLLGDCETAWTLYVDGYGEDGERIYDPFNGKSCHQCRQKTIGHRTNCNKCKLGQGQFCGDCLYTRYGENILEANQNPSWICPVCRGICNCSRCRRAKGWEPTAAIYAKVSRLGFKSVAHYLIQNRRSQTKQDEPAAENPVSANKSPSVDTEAKPPSHDEGVDSHISHDGIPNPQPKEDNNVEEYSDDEYKEEDDNLDDTDDDDSDDGDDDD